MNPIWLATLMSLLTSMLAHAAFWYSSENWLLTLVFSVVAALCFLVVLSTLPAISKVVDGDL